MSSPAAMSGSSAQQKTPAGLDPLNGEDNHKSMEKSLQKENKRLRGDIKQMEIKVKSMQGELKKSTQVKDRLEALCRELQKQNRFIKAESTAKITEANEKGKELAQEVQSNMGFIKNINENLASITSETIQVRKENDELSKKISTLKDHYEEREQVMKTVIDETSAALQAARLELGELKLKNAQEREKLLGEMQQLSQALIQSREQMKEAKETEINLRCLLQNYDDKFNGLQKALKDTNGAYEEFKGEMSKVTNRTKELELETFKWQKRWEESAQALKLMKENHERLQGELVSSEQGLEKMKGLCRALQNERKDLLEELKKKQTAQRDDLLKEVKQMSNGKIDRVAESESVAATVAATTPSTESTENSSSFSNSDAKETNSDKKEKETSSEVKVNVEVGEATTEKAKTKSEESKKESDKPQENPTTTTT